jgi:hypothetical protein
MSLVRGVRNVRRSTRGMQRNAEAELAAKPSLARLHVREEDHLPDGRGIG